MSFKVCLERFQHWLQGLKVAISDESPGQPLPPHTQMVLIGSDAIPVFLQSHPEFREYEERLFKEEGNLQNVVSLVGWEHAKESADRLL